MRQKWGCSASCCNMVLTVLLLLPPRSCVCLSATLKEHNTDFIHWLTYDLLELLLYLRSCFFFYFNNLTLLFNLHIRNLTSNSRVSSERLDRQAILKASNFRIQISSTVLKSLWASGDCPCSPLTKCKTPIKTQQNSHRLNTCQIGYNMSVHLTVFANCLTETPEMFSPFFSSIQKNWNRS